MVNLCLKESNSRVDVVLLVIFNLLDKSIARETLVGSNGEKNRGAVELSLCAIFAQFLVVLFAPFMGVVPGVAGGAMAASTDSQLFLLQIVL